VGPTQPTPPHCPQCWEVPPEPGVDVGVLVDAIVLEVVGVVVAVVVTPNHARSSNSRTGTVWPTLRAE